jgi:hypothetical protein
LIKWYSVRIEVNHVEAGKVYAFQPFTVIALDASGPLLCVYAHAVDVFPSGTRRDFFPCLAVTSKSIQHDECTFRHMVNAKLNLCI